MSAVAPDRPSAAAPARQRVLSRASFETRSLLANGEQLLVSVVLPALALVGLALAPVPDLGPDPRADVALALLLAGTVRAEAVLAIANLVWVLLLGLGVLFPTDLLPGALGTVAALLPSGALGDAMRSAVVDGGWPWPQWAVLVVWGLVGGLLARRWFRWGD